MTIVLDKVLEELADRVAERVAQKLGHVAVAVYTTAKRGPHIPGKSRAWMLKHARSMPGARKVGRDWIIGADDYQRWAAAKDAGRRAALPSPAASGPEALADRYLADLGFRPARKAG